MENIKFAINYLIKNKYLTNQIKCQVSQTDGYFVVQYEPLGIQAYAESREQAINEFKDEFLMLWEAYGQESDDNLTGDAIDLKSKILELVEGEQLIGKFESTEC